MQGIKDKFPQDDCRQARPRPSSYDADYFITTDGVLNQYRMPAGFKVKVLHPKEAMKRFQ